jgi:hypothetical protein
MILGWTAQVLSCNRDGMEALRKGQTKAVAQLSGDRSWLVMGGY